MASIHSIARSTAVAGAALILVAGATFAHDAATGGMPAAGSFSAAEDQDGPKADFDQGAVEPAEDAAERPEIDDQLEANDVAAEPAAAAEAPTAEKPAAAKPAKTEKHLKVEKAAKPAATADTADNQDDNDQGDVEDNDDGDQNNADDGDQNNVDDGNQGDSGDSHDGGGD